VVLYLPAGAEKSHDEDNRIFYHGSRFDHGSMIGSVTLRRRYIGSSDMEKIDRHVLYGTDMWRIPHNTDWPESGVGLASEFGVGDDGATCFFRCGWPEASGITNGLLGYQEAANGESFLKIGVGELIKGSCPDCDSTDDYRFNSPYLFASESRWKVTHVGKNSLNEISAIQMEHEATLNEFGYNLRKDIVLSDNVLTVTMTLKNLGVAPFSTVWYSHHFFTCDGNAVGPGYSIDMNLNGQSSNPVYTEPSTWSWSTPLDRYGETTSYPNSVHIDMKRTLEPGTRIKAEFADDHTTKGGFTLSACSTAIEATIESHDFSRHDENSLISMYAYNLYIERGTFSPEPQILIRDLQPNQETTWTLKLVIRDDGEVASSSSMRPWWNMRGIGRQSQFAVDLSTHLEEMVAYSGVIVLCCLLLLLLRKTWKRYRHRDYDEV
jgi:hypothetical protein